MITLHVINVTQEEEVGNATIPAEFETTILENPQDKFYYEDGEEIEQQWKIFFVFLAYVIAFLGSYSAIRLLEHGLWRSDREADNATTIISRYPKFATAFVLGLCTVWSMHFVGTQAVVLEGVDVCHRWAQSLGSIPLSIVGFWCGVRLASNDIFAGEDRVEILKQLLMGNRHVSSKLNRGKASHHIHMVALFHKLHWIAIASLFAAAGALSMHYVGMTSSMGPFTREWNWGYVGGSVLVGVVVCFAAFWILFRPLHWKVEKGWYRVAAAGVMAAAVCLLHFLGMMSVTYVADSSVHFQQCTQDFQGWRPDQLEVMCVVLLVPSIAFYVEHTISNELRVTYRQLLDIRLTGSQFMGGGKSKMHSHFSTGGSTTMTRSSRPFTRRRSSVKISGLDLPPSRYDSFDSLGPRHRPSMLTDESAMSALTEHNNLWNRNYTFEEDKKSAVIEGHSSSENKDEVIEQSPDESMERHQSYVDQESELENETDKEIVDDEKEQEFSWRQDANAEEGACTSMEHRAAQQQFSCNQEAIGKEDCHNELRECSVEETTEDTEHSPQTDISAGVTLISTNADLPLDTPPIPENAESDSSYFDDEASLDLEAGHAHADFDSSHHSCCSDSHDSDSGSDYSDSGYSDSESDEVGSFDGPDSLERFRRRESASLQGLIEDISRRHSLRHSLRQSLGQGAAQLHERARRHHSAGHAIAMDDSSSSQSTEGIKPRPFKTIWDGSKWVVDGSRALVGGTTQVVMGGSKKVGKMVVKSGRMAGKGFSKATHAAADTAMTLTPLRRLSEIPENNTFRRSTGKEVVRGHAPLGRCQTVDSAQCSVDLDASNFRQTGLNAGAEDFNARAVIEEDMEEVDLDQSQHMSDGLTRRPMEPLQSIWDGSKWVVDGSKALVGETTQVVLGSSKTLGKIAVKAGKGITNVSYAAADTAMALTPLRRTQSPEASSFLRSTGQGAAPFGRSQTINSAHRSTDLTGPLFRHSTNNNAPDFSTTGICERTMQESGLDESHGRTRRSLEPLHAIWDASTAVVGGSKAIVGETTQAVMGGSKKVGKMVVKSGKMAGKGVAKGGVMASTVVVDGSKAIVGETTQAVMGGSKKVGKIVVKGGAMAGKGVAMGGAMAGKGISKASHAAVDTAGKGAAFATPVLNFILMDENQGRRRRRSGHGELEASSVRSSTTRGRNMDFCKQRQLEQVPERAQQPRRGRISRRDRIKLKQSNIGTSESSVGEVATARGSNRQSHLDADRSWTHGHKHRRPPVQVHKRRRPPINQSHVNTPGRRQPYVQRGRFDPIACDVGATRQIDARHLERGNLVLNKRIPPAHSDVAVGTPRRFSF